MFNVSVFYNGFDLSSIPGVRIVNYNVTDIPSRSLSASKLARSNRSILTSAEYDEKSVTITGFVGGDNYIIMQDNFDRLKSYIQETEGVVKVQQGSKTVEYTGTLNGVSKTFEGPSMGFTLTFQCSDPIGRDAQTMNLIAPTAITTSSLALAVNVEGSFLAEPRFAIIVNAGTPAQTAKTISLLDAANGKGIKIKRNWVAGDVVTISS